MDTQSIIAIAIAALAGLWAARMLIVPFVASLRTPSGKGESGGCGGCGGGKDSCHSKSK